jgi:ligand-binding sensor domain-containing protein/signal transduction histidine kinase
MTPVSCLVRCWLLADLVFIFASTSLAESTNSAWSVHTWQSDDGLPNNNISSLAQTADGYLWAANSSQLARFDGVQFETFSSKVFGVNSSQRVHVLLRSWKGGLWLATDHGVVVYLNSGSAQIFTNGLPDLAAQRLIEDDEGSLWITYNRGTIYRLQDGKATLFDTQTGMPAGPACSLAKDNQGRIWFAKSDQGDGQVGVLRDGHFQTLLHFGLPIIRLAAARAGGVWICSGSQLFKYNEGGKLETLGRFMPGHANRKPKVMLEDSRGAVWIGTSDSGLFRYDGSDFEHVPISHPEISDLMEDREGNLWVGTSGGGLNRVRPRGVELEQVGKGLPFETAKSLCEDTNGVLWAATQNGFLVCRKNGVWSTAATNANWSDGDVTCVAADRTGAMWIGTKSHALYCLQEGRFTAWRTESNLASRAVRSLLASRAGDLWIGGESPSTLQCLRDGKLLSFKVPPNVRLIRAMAEDAAGNIWIGTSGGTLLKISHDVVTDETTARKAGDPMSIRCLYTTPDGSLWIGYAGSGLGRLKNGHFTRITTEQGLYDDYVSQIIADDRGWLWFGADHGIFKIRQRELEAVSEGKAARVRSTHYGRDEGLSILQANFDATPGAIRSHDGRLWIPMRTALAIINPNELRENVQPPMVLIWRVTLDERIIAMYGGVMPVQNVASLPTLQNVLRLPPRHHRLEFEFSALSFTAPENVHFRYQLEGFDENWIDADTQRGERRASYPQLPAGNYHFRVAACNSDGVWYELGAPLAFTVSPFFWQTWWFRAAAIIAFTLTVAAIVRYVLFRRLHFKLKMLEQQAALDNERTRIARDLHDDLGGSLTQVSLLLDMTQRDLLAGPDKTGKSVQQCSSMMRQVAESVDEIIWAINPRNDTTRYLIDYISQFTVEFLHAANIPCRVDLPDRIPDRTMSPEVRHNLFLVVKEALNNIAHHAQAGQVCLRVTATEEQIGITVEDNGQGFAHAPQNASADGLRNMRQRMEEISGQFRIESQPGTGTRVSFLYPWPGNE